MSRHQVTSWGDVQHVLTQLGGLSSDRIMAIELLWTPHDEGYFLTRDQVTEGYPELVPLEA